MRKLIMLSVALLIAACSDNQQPTSPVNAPARAASANQLNQGPQTSGKPQPGLVGFTQVAQYLGNWVTIQPGQMSEASVLCPDGWRAVAGGYQVASLAGTHPLISESIMTQVGSATGWVIQGMNDQAGAMSFQILPYVMCVS